MNQEIDEKIIAAIRSGKTQFHQIYGSLPLAAFRLVDRRLQALRKKGAITFNRKTGWSIIK